MKRQLQLILSALSFYTRCPVPQLIHDLNGTLLPDAIRYLPVIGWISGAVSGLAYLAAAWLFGINVGIILGLTAGILLTGAFHEDGFADVCDGFGGGYTKVRILEIMKDSHLGTYGVIGLLLLLGLKFAALQQLLESIHKQSSLTASAITLLVFVAAHASSRFAAIIVSYSYTYSRLIDSKVGAAVEQQKSKNLILAAIFTALPLVLLIIETGTGLFALIIIPVLLIAFIAGRYFKKHIGGYTGDCLGAVQQITELTIYFSYILIWRFI